MKKKAKGQYHHGSLKEGLIAEAIGFLSRRGDPAFTMRDLASRLGVSHSAAYRHFKSRESLLSAIAIEGFLKMAEMQREALHGTEPPWERTRKLGLVYIEFATAHPAHFRVMFGSELNKAEKYPELAKVSRATFQPVVAEVMACQKQGTMKPGNPESIAAVLWATVHGLAMLWIDGQLASIAGSTGSEAQRKTLASLLTDSILRGLTPQNIVGR